VFENLEKGKMMSKPKQLTAEDVAKLEAGLRIVSEALRADAVVGSDVIAGASSHKILPQEKVLVTKGLLVNIKEAILDGQIGRSIRGAFYKETVRGGFKSPESKYPDSIYAPDPKMELLRAERLTDVQRELSETSAEENTQNVSYDEPEEQPQPSFVHGVLLAYQP
jgi:hypothetical protein